MERNAKVRLAYSVFLGVFTLAVGVLFLASAADLYYAGAEELGQLQGMYSRGEVGARLLELLAPVLLWLFAIVLGIAVYAVFPVAPKRKGTRDDVKIYARLRRRAEEGKDPAAFSKVRRMEKIRLAVRVFSAAFCLLAACMCIVYLALPQHFTSVDPEILPSEILQMVKNVTPWVGAALLVLIGEAVFEAGFAKKLLPQVKLLAGKNVSPSKWEEGAQKVSAVLENKYLLLGVRCALFAVAVVFLGLGIFNGGANGVLVKAINICRECIGVG